jgi:hypothetical protein
MAKVVRKAPAQDRSTGRFVSPNALGGGNSEFYGGKQKGLVARVGDRKTRVVQPAGGLSLVGIDPGKTTGLAVWDAWDQRWYVDQLDAGRGRKVRLRVHGGFIESAAVIDGADHLGLRLASGIQVVRGGGKATKNAIDTYVERVVVQALLDVLLAVGPRCVVVMEDFVLGHAGGEGLAAAAIGRDGIAPVRLLGRLQAMMEHLGYFNGDAWRNFVGGWWTGGDGRGVSVTNADAATGKRYDGFPDLKHRLTRVEQHRLGDVIVRPGQEVVWGGDGQRLVLRYPHQRVWMAGGAKAQEAQMKADDWWLGGLPHAMVAMQHAAAVAREWGFDFTPKPERLWDPSAKIRNGRVSAKAAKS